MSNARGALLLQGIPECIVMTLVGTTAAELQASRRAGTDAVRILVALLFHGIHPSTSNVSENFGVMWKPGHVASKLALIGVLSTRRR